MKDNSKDICPIRYGHACDLSQDGEGCEHDNDDAIVSKFPQIKRVN